MPDENYICGECAVERGAIWPPHHAATCHSDLCYYCAREKGLCSIDDWDWPEGSDRPKARGGGRD